MSAERDSDRTLRLVLIVLAALLLAPVVLMLVMVPIFGMWGGMMGGGFGGGMTGLGTVGSLVWLVVLVGGGYLVYRALVGSGAVGGDPALEELRLAYARGELSDEEFEERRTRLEGE